MDDIAVTDLELAAQFDELVDDDLPSIGDLFHQFDCLVALVAQLDADDPANWVVG